MFLEFIEKIGKKFGVFKFNPYFCRQKLIERKETMNNAMVIGQQEMSYWNLLKNLSEEVKLRLIARLSASLVKPSEKTTSNVADKYYGAWSDDCSAEEMAENLRSARVSGTRTIVGFE